jgi:hypothetical protein
VKATRPLKERNTVYMSFSPEVLRSASAYILLSGIDDEGVVPGTGKINIAGRRVRQTKPYGTSDAVGASDQAESMRAWLRSIN